MNKKMIPNFITSLRIVGAIILLFIEPLSLPFYIVYSVCGLSDAVDGLIARKLDAASDFGSKLDSVSDLMFYIVMLVKLLPELIRILPRWIWYFVVLILLIRIASYIVSACKLRKFASAHTILNKVTGFLVFVIPYLVFTPFFTAYAILVCCSGFAASTQELIQHIKE